MAVSGEVFAGNASAAEARRSIRYRPTNSAARCCASAALPPFPAISRRFPRLSAWLIIFAAREISQIRPASSRMASCTWIFAARIPWIKVSVATVVAMAISSPGLQSVEFKAELCGNPAQFPHGVRHLVLLLVFAIEHQVAASARAGDLPSQRAVTPRFLVQLA